MRKSYLGVLLLSVLLLPACGYHFAGGSRELPFGIQSIGVDMLENSTKETGAENIFTNDLLYQLNTNSKATITDRNKADAVLSGSIVSIRDVTVARSSTTVATERRLKAQVALNLKDSAGELIWQRKALTESEAYEVGAANQVTEINRREALRVISKRLAENAIVALTDDF